MPLAEERDAFACPYEEVIAVYDRLKGDSMGGGVPTLLHEERTGSGGRQRWRYTVRVPRIARLLLPAELYCYDDVTWCEQGRWREEKMSPDKAYESWWKGCIVCRLWADEAGDGTVWSKIVHSQSEKVPDWILQSGLGWFMSVSAERRKALHKELSTQEMASLQAPPGSPRWPGRPPWLLHDPMMSPRSPQEEEESASSPSPPSPPLLQTPAHQHSRPPAVSPGDDLAESLFTCHSDGEARQLFTIEVSRDAGALGCSTKGTRCTGVVSGGPAAAAGLRPGMLFHCVDGTPVRSARDLAAALGSGRKSHRFVCEAPPTPDGGSDPGSCRSFRTPPGSPLSTGPRVEAGCTCSIQ
eukprot:TRINITY_DN61414_c0_g1_i1.p1 TRINITY_DN61414_c0_g1~~TRINITY_DN61414_c0_g1_i1.p1  ORF type:complete len:354 (+),score=94.26 TRINITY_DN61414_c0_g1_i1:80-1141(+)